MKARNVIGGTVVVALAAGGMVNPFPTEKNCPKPMCFEAWLLDLPEPIHVPDGKGIVVATTNMITANNNNIFFTVPPLEISVFDTVSVREALLG